MSVQSTRGATLLSGIQLTGRFAWNRSLTSVARRFTREETAANVTALSEARRAAASEVIRAQADLAFEYITDGGVGFLDLFSPYVGSVAGVKAGGNIDKYPGTRNSYYHTPLVEGRIKAEGHTVDGFLYTSEFPAGTKKKAILPSPVAFALACENTFYSNLEDLVRDFSEVLRGDVKTLSSNGYDYIQLTECFLPNPRFSGRASKRIAESLVECLNAIFEGFRGRSALYLHSGDASGLLPGILESEVTDVGFDFNTGLDSLRGVTIEKNLLLGLQNTTRKLPKELVEREPEVLAARVREGAAGLDVSGEAEIFLCPSQDFDGVQTYSQAIARLESLSAAFTKARSAK